jgi:hypothetical protein
MVKGDIPLRAPVAGFEELLVIPCSISSRPMVRLLGNTMRFRADAESAPANAGQWRAASGRYVIFAA